MPPTQMVREGQSFAVRRLSGRHIISNCTTGVEMPFALLFVFVGAVGRGVTNKIGRVDALTGAETTSDIRELATESGQIISSGLTVLIIAALVACGVTLLVSRTRWPRPQVLTTDGHLLAA